MLESFLKAGVVEAGCDEAGRGCLAGSVYAAAVVFAPDYTNPLLNDSKQLTARQRERLREEVERDAVAWAVGIVTPEEIDHINILNASITGMQRAVLRLAVKPDVLLVDGNRFKPLDGYTHVTVVHGDATYASIAAASVLAREKYILEMQRLSSEAGLLLPKGAGPKVVQVAMEFLKLHPRNELDNFAKTFFKTAETLPSP